MYRVGIIGCGRPRLTEGATGFGMSHAHAKGYTASPDATIVESQCHVGALVLEVRDQALPDRQGKHVPRTQGEQLGKVHVAHSWLERMTSGKRETSRRCKEA